MRVKLVTHEVVFMLAMVVVGYLAYGVYDQMSAHSEADRRAHAGHKELHKRIEAELRTAKVDDLVVCGSTYYLVTERANGSTVKTTPATSADGYQAIDFTIADLVSNHCELQHPGDPQYPETVAHLTKRR